MPFLQHSWLRTWHDLDLAAPEELRLRLLAAYAEPQRHYHTRQHVQECLAHFAAVLALAQRPGEVALALWFHDAVYDPRAGDNEARSAEWARAALLSHGASAEQAGRVQALILATRHCEAPTEPDAQLLLDIDLAILGAAPARFAEYAAQVRREYAWVDEAHYQTQRRAVLQGFLDRPVIYHTVWFRERYEQAARANLRESVSGLA